MLNIRYRGATLYVEGDLYKFHEVIEHKDNSVSVIAKRDGKIYTIRDGWNRAKYNSNEADRLTFNCIFDAWLFNKAIF